MQKKLNKKVYGPIYYNIPIMTTYYHGSSLLISELEPRPSRVIDNELAVFATNTRWLAAFFAAGNNDIGCGFFNDAPYIIEESAGGFDRYLKNVQGYIYHVSPTNFHSDCRLGMKRHEFISRENVKIMSVEKIGDIYAELVAANIAIITFDDHSHPLYKHVARKYLHKE